MEGLGLLTLGQRRLKPTTTSTAHNASSPYVDELDCWDWSAWTRHLSALHGRRLPTPSAAVVFILARLKAAKVEGSLVIDCTECLENESR